MRGLLLEDMEKRETRFVLAMEGMIGLAVAAIGFLIHFPTPPAG